MRCMVLLVVGLASWSLTASADEPPTRDDHPYAPQGRIRTLDMSPQAVAARRAAQGAPTPKPGDWSILADVESPDSRLDLTANPPVLPDPSQASALPEEWVQRGNVVLPRATADGELVVEPETLHQAELIPGNEYPRKHTLYLNFVGGEMLAGSDNSALNKSVLARQGPYPAYEGGDQKALAIAQAVADDVAAYGIRVISLPEDRPPPIVPYTMEMVGGNWMDVNAEGPAGGLAPGGDCGALGQRHVVYTFASAGLGVNTAANTASQEAGHAWGLDHTLNCGSVMSYCGVANGSFSDTCDPVCEVDCQGPNSASCVRTHEMFCGEDTGQQNDHEELTWLFGGNEPDVEDPFVNILSPQDGLMLESGADVDVRAEVGDDYGGYGWKFIITRNGEEMHNEVDFDREVDGEFHAALNLRQLEDGIWTVTVQVQDQFEHVATQTVSFQVGDELPPMTSDTGSETGDDMGTVGADDGTPPRGCGCAAGRRRSTGWAVSVALLGLLGLLGLRRRG